MPVFSMEKDAAIITHYKETLSVSKTASHFGCCTNSVYKLLRENDISLPSKASQRDLYKGSLAFTDFSKEEDSYFYGLLLTDGCMYDKRNAVSLSLKEQDSYMLRKLLDYIGSNNNLNKSVKDGHISYSVSFSSETIKKRLLEQNFAPHKSKRECLPNFNWIDNKHFWRGVVDGDGSVFFTNNSPKISLCGSKEILEGFNKFCQMNCFTKPRKLDRTKTEGFFTMCCAGEEALRIMKLLYDDSNIFLVRKKSRVDHYKQIFIPKSPNKNIRLLPSGRYNVKIGFKGERLNVGTYDTYEEALIARLDAEIKYQGKIRNDVNSSTTA